MLRLGRSGDARFYAIAPVLFAAGVAMAMGCCASAPGPGEAPLCASLPGLASSQGLPAELCVHAIAVSAVLALAAVAPLASRTRGPTPRAAQAA